MNLLQIKNILFILSLLLFLNEAKAQNENRPIRMYYNYNKVDIGAIIGIGQAYTDGFIQVDCPECQFEKALGASTKIGLVYERKISKLFGYAFFSTINFSQLKNSYLELETVNLENTFNEKADVTFRNSVSLNTEHLLSGAYLILQPTKTLFFQAGASFMIPVGSELIQEKELLTKTAKLTNGLIVNIALDPNTGNAKVGSDSKKAIVQKSPYSGLQIPIYGDFATGLELKASKKISISPMLEFSIPLLPLANQGENLYTYYWKFSIKIKYNLDETFNY